MNHETTIHLPRTASRPGAFEVLADSAAPSLPALPGDRVLDPFPGRGELRDDDHRLLDPTMASGRFLGRLAGHRVLFGALLAVLLLSGSRLCASPGASDGEEVLRRPVESRVPELLAARLGDGRLEDLEVSRIRAWEIELESEVGPDVEVLLDVHGRPLLVFSERVDGDGDPEEPPEAPLGLDDLPPEAAETIRRFAGPSVPVELGREMEWGAPSFEAEWSTEDGDRELVVLEDGTFVALELGSVSGDSLPEALRFLADGREVEGLAIDVYRVPGIRPSHWLASGIPIGLPEDPE